MGQTEGLSLYWNDCCVMQQTVHDGACNHWITKNLVPLGKIDVGCDDCAITLIPSVNQLKEKLGVIFGDWQITQLVNNQKLVPAQFFKSFIQTAFNM